MKATGIVRQIDELGRIVLPMELRRTLHIGEKDGFEIYTEGDTIILKKHEPKCVLCDSDKALTKYKGKLLCRTCIFDMK